MSPPRKTEFDALSDTGKIRAIEAAQAHADEEATVRHVADEITQRIYEKDLWAANFLARHILECPIADRVEKLDARIAMIEKSMSGYGFLIKFVAWEIPAAIALAGVLLHFLR